MTLTEQPSVQHAGTTAPPASPWRLVVAVTLGSVLTGAVYLYIVRGPMLLLDLATGMGGVFCF